MRDVSVSGKPTGIRALQAKENRMEAAVAKVEPKSMHKISHHSHHSHASISSEADKKKAEAALEVSLGQSDDEHHHEAHHKDHHGDHGDAIVTGVAHVDKAIAKKSKLDVKVIIKKKAAETAAQKAEDKALFAQAEREAMAIVQKQFERKSA
jgi:colicin import membrane protein